MKKKQDDTQEFHHEGTGSWFLGGPQFGEWKDKPGCLWMRGNCRFLQLLVVQCLIGRSWYREKCAQVTPILHNIP
jgi:hypothetical protein